MEMEIQQAIGAALPTLESLLRMTIPSGMLMASIFSPLGEETRYDSGGRCGFGRADFPASAAAVAGLEKHKFVAGGGDDDDCGGDASGCSICLQEFEDGEEVSVMQCSHAHEFHHDYIAKWLGVRNTCPLYRRGLPTYRCEGDDGQ